MRRSPFFAYPSYPLQHPHPFFTPSADNAFHYPPFPSSSPSASASAGTSGPVINIPVHDSPPSRPVNPHHRPSPAPLLHPASAATTIQSHFRGFSIRRHRPLLHLRSIAGARKQLEELKSELENPGFAPKVRASDKERLIFSESVMAVILRLDAIEGSIPEVRSQRKEATKMAIKLQDAIDAMMVLQDDISDPNPEDGALSDAAMDEENDSSDCKKIEGSLINMVQEVMPTELGGPTLAADAHMMRELTPTFLEFSPTYCCTMAMMDMDNNDVMKVVDERCLPLPKVGDAGLEVVDSGHIVYRSDSPTSDSQDVSVEAMDAADHDIHCAHEKVAVNEATCVVEADVNSGSGCVKARCCIVQEDMTVAKEYEDICVDDGEVLNCDLGKDVGHEDEEGFSHPGTPIAEEKLDPPHYSSDATKVARDRLCCASPPQEDLEDQYQGSSALEDSLLERLTENNCSCQGADAPTLCRRGCENHLPSTDSSAKPYLSSDSILLKQLSEDCRQLKSLLGKVLAHSKAQSKVICALGDRLEVLEHQQELHCQNSSRKTREKRKLKKGSKRNVKAQKH